MSSNSITYNLRKLKKYEQRNNQSGGNPTYDAKIRQYRQILDGAKYNNSDKSVEDLISKVDSLINMSNTSNTYNTTKSKMSGGSRTQISGKRRMTNATLSDMVDDMIGGGTKADAAREKIRQSKETHEATLVAESEAGYTAGQAKEKLEELIRNFESQIKDLKDQLTALNAEKAATDAQLKEVEKNLEAEKTAKNQAVADLTSIRSAKESAESELAQLELTQSQATADADARASQLQSELAAAKSSLTSIEESLTAQITANNTKIEELDDAKSKLETEAAELDTVLAELYAHLDELNKKNAELSKDNIELWKIIKTESDKITPGKGDEGTAATAAVGRTETGTDETSKFIAKATDVLKEGETAGEQSGEFRFIGGTSNLDRLLQHKTISLSELEF